jgi:hypothetical protein
MSGSGEWRGSASTIPPGQSAAFRIQCGPRAPRGDRAPACGSTGSGEWRDGDALIVFCARKDEVSKAG